MDMLINMVGVVYLAMSILVWNGKIETSKERYVVTLFALACTTFFITLS